jgi:preprotein translocase subunit SecA
VEGLLEYLRHYFPLAPDTTLPDEAFRGGQAGLVEHLYDAAVAAYEAKEAELGDEQLRGQVERFVMLRTIDQKWVDYLTQMEHFREGIGLQAYGQRDPLVEYKIEAHKMFDELTAAIKADIVANMFRVQVMPQEAPPEPTRVDAGAGVAAGGPVDGADGEVEAANGAGAGAGRAGGAPAGAARANGGAAQREPAGAGAKGSAKIGRNDLCWCGSGKKYKRCHGR